MKFTYDIRRLPRSLPDWDRLMTELGQATDDTVEASWLELKGPLELTTAAHKFALARAILAFANRDPDAASAFLDGHALVVVGVSTTGDVTGVSRIEDHQLLKAVEPYLGQDDQTPRWIVHRHRVNDTHDVLIVDVDAPKPGDPIYTLRKAFDKSAAGTIFTRPSTATEPADPAAIQMLSRRLTTRTNDFEVAVSLNSDAITRYTWDPDQVNRALQRQINSYLNQLPGASAGTRQSLFGSPLMEQAMAYKVGLNSRLDDLVFETHEETRSEEEFQQELEEWAHQLREAGPDNVRNILALRQPPATFTITNTCGRFLEDLEVEVHIEGPVTQHSKLSEEDILKDLPRRPRKWGPWKQRRANFPDIAGPIFPASYGTGRPLLPRPNSTDFRNSGSVTAVLRCKELRPRREHTFSDADDHHDVVFLTPDLNLSTARVTITATARGVDDAHVTEFSHPVTETVDATETIARLLAFSSFE